MRIGTHTDCCMTHMSATLISQYGVESGVEVTTETISTGEELVEALSRFGPHHPRSLDCPYCGKSVGREALTVLLYAFERCTCERETTPHLIEQVWHRTCFSAKFPV